jgi:hypothetical protein
MPCERYEQDLIEAAATGAELPNTARKHVDACAGCRAALAGERALFAAIDAGMHKIANAELPRSFLPRVQANLSAQPIRTRNLIPTWAFLCATSVVALVIGVLGLSRRSQKPGAATGLAISTAASGSSADRGTSLPNASLLSGNSRRLNVRKAPNQPNISEARNIEPEVLVPPGEEVLLLRFYETVRAAPHPLKTVATEHDLPPKPLAIDQIEVTGIKIEGLEQGDGLGR